MKLARSESNYDRTKVAFRDDTTCDGCGEFRSCVCTDSSDGKYGDVCLCQECIAVIFAEPAIERGEWVTPPPDMRPKSASVGDLANALAESYTPQMAKDFARKSVLAQAFGLDLETHRTSEQARLNGEKKT